MFTRKMYYCKQVLENWLIVSLLRRVKLNKPYTIFKKRMDFTKDTHHSWPMTIYSRSNTNFPVYYKRRCKSEEDKKIVNFVKMWIIGNNLRGLILKPQFIKMCVLRSRQSELDKFKGKWKILIMFIIAQAGDTFGFILTKCVRAAILSNV
jgi:hypothetical protein